MLFDVQFDPFPSSRETREMFLVEAYTIREDPSYEPKLVPTCVFRPKNIKTLGFKFILNIQKDKQSETLSLGLR